MSQRYLAPTNLFYRQNDPWPPEFPYPNTGDIYFNVVSQTIRVFYEGQWHDASVSQSGMNDYLKKSGGTMTGPLVLPGDPGASLEAAPMQYVDAEAAAAQAAAQAYADSQDAVHVADGDPHPQYLTPAEGDAAYDAAGTSATGIANHVAAGDPHAQYATEEWIGKRNPRNGQNMQAGTVTLTGFDGSNPVYLWVTFPQAFRFVPLIQLMSKQRITNTNNNYLYWMDDVTTTQVRIGALRNTTADLTIQWIAWGEIL